MNYDDLIQNMKHQYHSILNYLKIQLFLISHNYKKHFFIFELHLNEF